MPLNKPKQTKYGKVLFLNYPIFQIIKLRN